MYVQLDDKWHALRDSEYTWCALEVPEADERFRDLPPDETVHCGPDAPEPKPKAKKAK